MSYTLGSLDDTIRVDNSTSIDCTANDGAQPEGVTLAAAIRHAISTEVGARVRNLDVEPIGREVVISGTASSYYVKQLVTHAVLTRLHDHTLTNAIRVISKR